MAYPFDGEPNLRPGAERSAFSAAPRFDPALSLDELFEDFLGGSVSIINDWTETVYRYDWGMYRAWLDATTTPALLGTITKQHLIDDIAHLQRRPKALGVGTLSSHTVHHYTRVLRTFIRWMICGGLYPIDPLAGGRRGPMPKMGPRLLKVANHADVEILLAGTSNGQPRNVIERATRARDHLVVWLVTDTGLRTSEVTHLRIGDVDFGDAWARITASKWDRERRVPLSRETVAVLRLYLRRDRPLLSATPADATRMDETPLLSRTGEASTVAGLYLAMCRAYKRGGGVGRFGLHRLRHYWGTTAAEDGMHAVVSQAIVGHEDEKSQRVYQHPSDAVIKREHSRMTPIRRISPVRRRKLA